MTHSVSSFVARSLLGVALLLAAGCSREAKRASHLADADRYFAAGQYDRAEIEYLNVLRDDQSNAHVIAQLGTIYFEQGRPGRAYPLILRAKELQPDNLPIRLKAGHLLLLTGNPAEARKEAEFVLDRDPRNDEAPLLLAEASPRADDMEATRQRLSKLPPPANESAAVLVALGTLQARQEHAEEAEALFKRALAADPKSAAAYAAMGTIYRIKRQLPEADAAFKQASELSTPRAARRLLYPRFKLQTGDVKGGRAILEEMVKQTPDYFPAWLALAEVAIVEKKYDEGLELVGKVLTRDSMHPEALLLSARLQLSKGNADKAIEELEKMIKLYPKSPQIYYQLGLAYVAKKDISNAVANLSRATAIAPDLVEATLALAEINLRRGDYISVINALTPVVQKRPEIIQAHLFLAEAYRGRGDLESALAEYQRTEALFPTQPQVQMLKGTILVQQNNKDAARKAFNKTLELAPGSLTAVEQLVDLDISEQNYTAAMQRVNTLITQNPKAAGPYLIQSKIYAVQKDIEHAEAALHKALELQPDSAAAYLLLARLYVNAKQTDKALQNFQTVVAKDPKHVESWMLIGLIYEQQKNYTGAAEAYEKLLAANPSFASALNNLACLCSDHLNQQERALELAQRAREMLPNEPHIADSLGWILYKQRQFSRALGLLRESAARLPDSTVIQYHLGMASYMMGDDAAARQLLQRALDADKTLPETEEAQRCLAVLAINPAEAGARAKLEKLATERPEDPAVLSRLAAAYEREGMADQAMRAATAAQKANPSHVPVLMQLVQMNVTRKDFTKAIALAKDARKLAPDDADIAYTLGRLAFESGDYRWAAGLLQEAVLKKSDNADVLYDFAEASYHLGQIPEAEAAARRAMEAGSLFLRADKARLLAELSAASASPASAAKAAAQVDQALRADADYLPALYVSALALEQNPKPDDAKRVYEKIKIRYPDFSPAQKRLAALTATAAKPAGDKK